VNVSVLATAIGHLAVVTQDIKELSGIGGGDAFVESMREEPVSVALAVYSAAIVWFTVGLCMYHTYLICTNQTTYEQIKGVYSTGTNPFHRGVAGNCQDILFNPVRPRYFNAADNQLLWNATPPDEAAREIRFPAGSGEKRYLASGGSPLRGPREGAQAQAASNVSNDPFLTVGVGVGATKIKDENVNATTGQEPPTLS
jgi:hypothetical protein